MNRCEDCAFSAGTKANADDLTRLKTKLCVDTGEPFFCHSDVNELVRDGIPYSEALRICGPNEPENICAGWLEAVAKRGEAGTLETGWKRDVLVGLLDLMYDCERDPNYNPAAVPALMLQKTNEALEKYRGRSSKNAL